jgi:phosphoglycerol transferase MdoB-like AlkP superfamily enzyme
MKRHLNKSLVYFLIYFALLVYFETGLRVFTQDTGFTVMPYVFSLWFAILLTGITLLFKHTVRALIILTLLMVLLFGSQVYYYLFFNTFYILYSLFRAQQVAQSYWREILVLIQENLQVLFFYFLPFVLLLVGRKKIPTASVQWQRAVIVLGVAVLGYGLTAGSILIRDKDDPVYDATVYHPEAVASIREIGVLNSLGVDLFRMTNEAFGNTNAVRPPVDVDPDPDPDPDPTVFNYNKLDIPFESLIANAPNATIKAMHEYFSQRTPTKQNAKTGMFEGYNLILLTAESFSRFAVREDITPTLYKMVHEGFYVPNFYNPIWGVSTSDGEYVQFTSLIPKPGVWSMAESSVNDMGFVLGHQLKNLGYSTYAFHDHYCNYYKRDQSHPNLGYDYKAVYCGLTYTHQWPQSDLDMMKETVPMFINDEKFHVYYMTVSGHPNYTWRGNMMATKNRDLVKDLPYTEYVQGYLATQIELDRALEYLMDELEKAGKLDKTLFVLSADHYPYYLKSDQLQELNNGVAVDRTFELYRSSVIMYNSAMEPETILKPMSSMDILPTVSNLMGLDFDSRLMMGTDIFSPTDPVVIFLDRSFITPAGRYNAKTKEFTPNPGVTVSPQYVEQMIQRNAAKFYYSQKFLENDYYKLISASLGN